MPIIFDTSVAIAFRDSDPLILAQANALVETAQLSVLTAIELESGVAAALVDRAKRRAALDAMYDAMPVLPFGVDETAAYRAIVEQLGYSRRKLIDRMIAAQALVAGAVLATLNPRDFQEIPGLRIEDWSR